jgi:hypothetical protein
MTKRLSISFRLEPDRTWQVATGRDAWALIELHRAGKHGVTPVDTPGPRGSGYVFNLRRMGLVIETVHESHDGPFPGSHARYVLHSEISIIEGEAHDRVA